MHFSSGCVWSPAPRVGNALTSLPVVPMLSPWVGFVGHSNKIWWSYGSLYLYASMTFDLPSLHRECSDNDFNSSGNYLKHLSYLTGAVSGKNISGIVPVICSVSYD